MYPKDEHPADVEGRRDFLRYCSGAAVSAGAVALLAGCNEKYGAARVEEILGTPAPAPSAGPSFSATENDYLNFALQIQYLTTAFFWRSAFGGSVDTALIGGAGTAGAVSGGSQVQFDDQFLMQALREMALEEAARLRKLRSVLGSSVTAQPAINIAGGASSPFDSIASRDVFPSTTPFNPYASVENFLLGASAISWLGTAAFRGISFRLTNAASKDAVLGMIAGKSHHDSLLRLALWRAGLARKAFFDSAQKMAEARNKLNGSDGTYLTANYDYGVQYGGRPAILVLDYYNSDGNPAMILARSPELTLNIAYGTKSVASSGAFFPAGVNGLIKNSNAAG